MMKKNLLETVKKATGTVNMALLTVGAVSSAKQLAIAWAGFWPRLALEAVARGRRANNEGRRGEAPLLFTSHHGISAREAPSTTVNVQSGFRVPRNALLAGAFPFQATTRGRLTWPLMVVAPDWA